uniref:F-box associated beta-propeller type 3 domain-containing protein n=1 Tax=Aegilops tauschii TaxID=37682 RepID=R7W860_AEGTA
MRSPHDLALVCLPGADDGLRLQVLDPVIGVQFALPDVDHDREQPHHASFMFGRASTGDYKVLCIRTSGPNGQQQLCRVLTLSGNAGDHGWRETACPPAQVSTGRREAVAVKGVAYFLLHGRRPEVCIMAYDLEKELWRPASLPVPLPSNSKQAEAKEHVIPQFGRAGRLLGPTVRGLGGVHGAVDWEEFMELWLLMDPGKVIWSKRCTITVPYRYQGVHDSRVYPYFAEMLWLLDDGRIVIWMLLAESGLPHAVLCTYDPRTMSYTDVADMPNYIMGGVYTGSLLGRESFLQLHQGSSA